VRRLDWRGGDHPEEVTQIFCLLASLCYCRLYLTLFLSFSDETLDIGGYWGLVLVRLSFEEFFHSIQFEAILDRVSVNGFRINEQDSGRLLNLERFAEVLG